MFAFIFRLQLTLRMFSLYRRVGCTALVSARKAWRATAC